MKFKKGSKYTTEALEEGGKYVQSSICSIKTPEWRYWPRSNVFIVNLTYFTRYSTASIVDFELVNVS